MTRLREATRVNVLVTTAVGKQLRFNPLGPRVSTTERRQLLREITRSLGRAGMLILSGSLPRGLPAGAYAQLVRRAREEGVPALVDCDGAAFSAAVRARPLIVKPNRHELMEWWAARERKGLREERSKSETRNPKSEGNPKSESGSKSSSTAGRSLSDFGLRNSFGFRSSEFGFEEILHVAQVLSDTTSGWVLLSGGGQPSLLINHALQAEFLAQPPRVTPLNTLGAGDAMLAAAAWQLQMGAPPEEWLQWGVAAGTAATQCRPGELPSPKLLLRLFGQTRLIHRARTTNQV